VPFINQTAGLPLSLQPRFEIVDSQGPNICALRHLSVSSIACPSAAAADRRKHD